MGTPQPPAADPSPAEFKAAGNALHAEGRLEDAVTCYRAAVRKDPGYAEAHNDLGVALKTLGRIDEARASYQQAIALSPQFANALFNLGTTYFLARDFATATHWYQLALAADPAHALTHQNLALILLDAGHLAEAQAHRDIAFGQQSVFLDTTAGARRTVLCLWAAGQGNVPIQHLIPTRHNNLITWMIEYGSEAQARELPPYDIVFNAIGDADVLPPALAPMTAFIRACPKRVLNLPAQVAATSRERLPQLFAHIDGVWVPPVVRIERGRLGDGALEGQVPFPILIRPTGSHGGSNLALIESPAALSQWVTINADAYYFTHFCDFQSPDRHYRKYRVVFVDRRPFPYHLAISDHWLVHYDTAHMPESPWKLTEEHRFLSHPEESLGGKATAALAAIGRALDLDYCGIDFSLLPDGRLLVFEANATMLVHPEPADGPLAFRNPYVQDILDAFERVLEKH